MCAMKILETFIQRSYLICLTLVLMVCISGATITSTDTRCTRPQLESPWLKLFMYIRSPRADSVMVYKFEYRVKSVCNKPPCLKCEDGSEQRIPTVYTTSDVEDLENSQVIERDVFRDQYGNLDTNISRTIGNCLKICGNGTFINRTTTIELIEYDFLPVDYESDMIKLGYEADACKFSTGFCRDEARNIELIWNTRYNDTETSCNLFEELRSSSVYFLILNNIKYAVVDERPSGLNGLSFYELKNSQTNCGVKMWETDAEGVIISEGPIKNARLIQNYYRNYPFATREELYYFLINKCVTELPNSSNGVVDKEKSSSATFPYIENGNNIDTDDEDMRFQLLICYYLSIANTACFTMIALLLIHCLFRKIFCGVRCAVNDSTSCSKSVPYDSEIYEIMG